jgi:hypothetical protein
MKGYAFMKNLLSRFLDLFSIPDATAVAQQQLAQARLELLHSEACLEHYQQQTLMLAKRVTRLQRFDFADESEHP